MATAKDAAVKRPKTGGRAKKSLDQHMAETRIRSELAAMPDDTLLPSELAAIYLGISEKKLAELRQTHPRLKDGSRDKSKPLGPKMIKYFDADAVKQNQPVFYKLGALRKYQEASSGHDSYEVAVAGGLLGWVSLQAPFLAQVSAPRRRSDTRAPWERPASRPILVSKAFGWGSDLAAKEAALARVLAGELRVVWLTPAEAAVHNWTSVKAHRAYVKPWLATLKSHASTARAALEGTELWVIVEEERASAAQQPKRGQRAIERTL